MAPRRLETNPMSKMKDRLLDMQEHAPDPTMEEHLAAEASWREAPLKEVQALFAESLDGFEAQHVS